jgi:hypothetical protein
MTKLSDEDIEKIREEAKTMKSRYEIAKEFGVAHTAIYWHTKDIPTPRQRQPHIRGKCLEVLKKILTDGYYYSGEDSNEIRKLQYIFPMIKRTQFNGKSIFYLEDKNKIALESMIKTHKNKVIKYRDLKALSKLFNVEITINEKDDLFNRKSKNPIIRRKDGGFLSSYSKHQTNLDDY